MKKKSSDRKYVVRECVCTYCIAYYLRNSFNFNSHSLSSPFLSFFFFSPRFHHPFPIHAYYKHQDFLSKSNLQFCVQFSASLLPLLPLPSTSVMCFVFLVTTRRLPMDGMDMVKGIEVVFYVFPLCKAERKFRYTHFVPCSCYRWWKSISRKIAIELTRSRSSSACSTANFDIVAQNNCVKWKENEMRGWATSSVVLSLCVHEDGPSCVVCRWRRQRDVAQESKTGSRVLPFHHILLFYLAIFFCLLCKIVVVVIVRMQFLGSFFKRRSAEGPRARTKKNSSVIEFLWE